MDNINQTKEFINLLLKAYFIERDTPKMLSMISTDILWNGTHDGQLLSGYEGLVQCFKLGIEHYPMPFDLSIETLQIMPLNDTQTLVQGCIHASQSMPGTSNVIFTRLSCSCIVAAQAKGGMKLIQLHYTEIKEHQQAPDIMSVSLNDASEKHLQTIIDRTAEELKARSEELEARKEDLKTLAQNIPGGIFRCLYDHKLTIIQANDGFLNLFGYTLDEIQTRFNNSFLEMIDPQDRERILNTITHQLTQGNTKEIEYRVTTKDGRKIWVIDKGKLMPYDRNHHCFYCILIDITKSKKSQDELRLSLERHRIIMDQTDDIIFEWDLKTDRILYSPNWGKKFGYAPITERFWGSLAHNQHIHSTDIQKLLPVLRSLKEGAPYAEIELRLESNEANEFIWCRIRMTTQYNANQAAIKVVGVIVDIDDAKRQSQALIEKAERDALTKLYNKGTSESIIRKKLAHQSSTRRSAMMIIDIDNFKIVNDSQGHLFGDAFLIEISDKIQHIFRSSDVVGRIGGDEFIVFIEGIPNIELVEDKAKQVIDIFCHLDVFDADKTDTSCSIGIAYTPEHGIEFNTLYKKADYALYQAKNDGKNQYKIFTNDMETAAMLNMPLGVSGVVSGRIDSDNDAVPQTVHSQLVEYVFRILYKSIDIETAVKLILEIVGRQYDVSRVYIFENSDDNTSCCNTFEWCNDGVAPEINNLSRVLYKDLGQDYIQNFDENGLFYCRDISDLPPEQYDILNPQGIKSMLQCAIRDNGAFKGYVGFDECRKNRFWTQEQIVALSFIAEILSIFLLKRRAQDHLEQSNASMQEILNNQNSWIYVIDAKTYALLYINSKTLSIAPDAHPGMTCYQAFFKRDSPCIDCPLTGLSPDQKNNILEIHNPVLKVWSAADASRITWKNRPAWLLSCHDITRYKEQDAKKED